MPNHVSAFNVVAVLALAAILLSSCDFERTSEANSTLKSDLAETSDQPLVEQIHGRWRLVEVTGPAGTIRVSGPGAITTFSQGRVIGSDGCNRYGGSFELQGSTIVWVSLGGELAACDRLWNDEQPEFHGIKDLTVTIDGDVLVMSNPDYQYRFERAG